MCCVHDTIACLAPILVHTYIHRLGYMYWTNYNERVIKRARLNGTEITRLVAGDILYPGEMQELVYVQTHLHGCNARYLV